MPMVRYEFSDSIIYSIFVYYILFCFYYLYSQIIYARGFIFFWNKHCWIGEGGVLSRGDGFFKPWG